MFSDSLLNLLLIRWHELQSLDLPFRDSEPLEEWLQLLLELLCHLDGKKGRLIVLQINFNSFSIGSYAGSSENCFNEKRFLEESKELTF